MLAFYVILNETDRMNYKRNEHAAVNQGVLDENMMRVWLTKHTNVDINAFDVFLLNGEDSHSARALYHHTPAEFFFYRIEELTE